MANQSRRNGKWRSKARRNPTLLGRAHWFHPLLEGLEARRLLTIVINEFGGSNTVTEPAGITLGPDDNLWFTESNPADGAIGRITPSGAIENFSNGLLSGATPNGIASGSDGDLWFTDPASNMIGQIDTSGNIVEYNIPTPNSDPNQITAGPDGDLWFTETDSDKIGQITTTGDVTEFTIPTANSQPVGITAGPDGALWFTESAGDKIGRITTTGQFTEFSTGITANSGPEGIALGPDGNLWFTEQTADQVARITTQGVVTEYSIGISPGAGPAGITAGPDGNLWFTEANNGKVGSITTEGAVTEFSDPAVSPTAALDGIAAGPDGNLWFTESSGNHVDRITTTGTITQFPPPPADTIFSDSFPEQITAGPDNALWFTEFSANQIGRIDTSGAITQYFTGISPNAGLGSITEGPSGGGTPNLYFTESNTDNIGEITTAGTVTEFPLGVVNGSPTGITLGPDSNLWFTENIETGSITNPPFSNSGPQIISISPTGTLIDDFALPVQFVGDTLNQIATGPDGALWFTFSTDTGGEIGRVTTAGQFSFFPITNAPGLISEPIGIVKGFNNDLWFADFGNSAIGEITTAGVITEFSQGLTSSDIPDGITAGPDGNYWFTDPSDIADPIGSITPQGVITLYQTPTPFAGPIGITTGPDNNIWFAESNASQIGQAVLPQGISNPLGKPENVVATLPFTFVVATFGSSAATNAANFSATIDYGDGSSGPGTIVGVPDVPGSYEVVGSHTYATPGMFTAEVTISTGTGSLAPVPAAIDSLDPLQVAGAGVDGIAGRRTNTLVATFTDLDSSATLADFAATINWADGTSSAGFVYSFTSSAGGPEFAVYAGHVFAAQGSYVNSVVIEDTRNGVTGSANSTATVAAAPTSSPFNEFGPDSLTPGAQATAITEGPDDALWFTEDNSGYIGRIDTSGNVTEFLPTGPNGNGFSPNSHPTGITTGPDGALWFTESSLSQIGRVTTAGVFEEFSSGITPGSEPGSITLGPDDNLWFTEFIGNQIGMINPTTDQVTEYSGLPSGFFPDSITSGPDGNLWFVASGSDLIGRITPQGVITFYPGATSTGFLSITEGPDNDLWFTESNGNKIGKIDPTTFQVTEYTSPSIVSPIAIAASPDGNLYFTGGGGTPSIDQITTSGVVTPFTGGLTLNSNAGAITAGPDGNIYITEVAGDKIGQLVLPGSITNATGVPANVLATVPSSYEVATFTDTSAGTNASNFTVTIDDGDGTSSPGTVVAVAGSPGSFEVFDSHTYTTVGMFTAEITIGTAVGSIASVSAAINSTSPLEAFGSPVDGIAGRRSNTLVASFTDLDTTATASDFTATITWGDNTTSTGFVYLSPFGEGELEFNVYAGHDFAAQGSYIDSIVIVDNRNGLTVDATSHATIAAAPTFTPYNEVGPDTLTPGAGATGITQGPDHALWFTESNSDMIGRIDTSGNVTEYPIPTADSDPTGITTGPDGNLWFTETNADRIGRITPSGVVTEFFMGISSGAAPDSITKGPDGNLWFTESGPFNDGIGRITPQGVVTQFRAGLTSGFFPDSITLGSDGNLWFVGTGSGQIGRITPAGVITLFSGATSTGFLSITKGPDNDLWFTETDNNAIGKINPTTFQVTEYTSPSIDTPIAITSGPDGHLYFTGGGSTPQVDQITTSGVVTPLSVGLTLNSALDGIATGPDGNVYFTETAGDRIGQLVLPQSSITSLNAGELFVSPGQEFSGTFANFTEASTIPTTANFDAVINWGDGTTADVVVTMGSDGEFTVFGSHTYANVGTYTGLIGIFNDAGSKVQHFTVVVQPPISVSAVPFSVPANRTFTQVVANFSTPPSGLQSSAYLATIYWGDGTSSDGSISSEPNPGGLNFQFFVTGTHDYPVPGTYEVTTTVQLVSNPLISASSTAPATVTSAILSASPVNIQATVGTPFEGAVANVTDSSQSGVLGSTYEAAINWGDGTPMTVGTIVDTSPTTFQVDGSHVYNQVGNFPVTVVIIKSSTLDETYTISTAQVGSTLSFVVINTNDSGFGSLRQVILNADSVGGHAITFAIPGSGVETIGIDSPLPMITGPTVIDGPSQAAFEGIVPTHPLIEIDGQYAGSGAVDGLTFGANSAGSLLLSVSIFGFSGAQVEIEAPLVTLFGNVIGLRADGTIPQLPGGGTPTPSFSNVGVEVVAPGAVIGGAYPFEGNLISGNEGWGILIDGAPAALTQIVGNLIGLDPTGTVASPNLLDGVAIINGANHEFIGPGNTISGNSGNGISVLDSSSDLISGNAIGTGIQGRKAIANGDYGIDIDQASNSILIGGTDPLSPNVISGNNVVGVGIQGGSSGIVVEGNRIGTDSSGELGIGNGIAGVLIEDSSDNTIGPGNLVSGNGILCRGPASGSTGRTRCSTWSLATRSAPTSRASSPSPTRRSAS